MSQPAPEPEQGTLRGERPSRLLDLNHSPEEVLRKTAAILDELQGMVEAVPAGDIHGIPLADLSRLLAAYDVSFFDGLLARMLFEDGGGELEFRFSSRMTRAAGKTIVRRHRSRGRFGIEERRTYEIVISTTILLATFREAPGRVVSVGGLPCRDWMEALLRIFEHELLHLAEFLAWGASNCAAENYQTLSRRIFGHVSRHHELVTPREHAAERHGIRPGDHVGFSFDGVRLVGRVNRITRRATVLVEDPRGQRFTDGRSYLVYYVPITQLSKHSQPR